MLQYNYVLVSLSWSVVHLFLHLLAKLVSEQLLHQRAIHQECSGSEKYWNLIDARLAYIRKVAGSDQTKIIR